MMDDPLAVHPLADSHLVEQVRGALLEHAGAHAFLHVLAVAVLEDHRLDARAVEQRCQHESGGACADDPNLGPVAHAAQLNI